MDGNKDEALKCLAIGKKALGAGDRPRALKFLAKARRLDPSLAVDDLPGNTQSSIAPNAPHAAKAKAPLDGPSQSKAYTDEQIMIVRQIKKQRDYYQILGVKRECTVEDVRKAYRKLSLKVHPDKNQAPGAEEAFKAVSKAFQCLNNNESRKKYDVVGSEETDYGRPAAHHRHASNGFYQGDVDAEEIFTYFFFRGGAPAGVPFGSSGFRAGPSFHGVHVSDGIDVRSLLKMVPFIVLLLVNVLPAFLSSSGPVYMLSRSYRYSYNVETPRGVPYYVKSAKYEEDFPPESYDRITVEQKVDREYFGILRQNCRAEMQRRQWGGSNHMPHCQLLQKFQDTKG